MFTYYLRLAALSLRHNPILTALMVAAIALGIGASMTSLTVLRAMSGNPLPQKEGLVYRPQVDNWAPGSPYDDHDPGRPPKLMTYRDATNLYRANKGVRQAVLYPNVLAIEPANTDLKPYMARVLFTHGDFFPMFDVPFLFGNGWDRAQDQENARVAVLSRETNEKLFGGTDSTGKTVRIGGEDFRVAGVMDRWEPAPRFYETGSGGFQPVEDVFLPFNNGISRQLQSNANNSCWKDPGDGYAAWLESECIWLAFWVELESPAAATEYKTFLDNYVTEQKKLGRFERPLNTRLETVMQWLRSERVVSRDARTQLWMAVAFLVVCLINTVGLLLAKFLARSPEIGLRRAVGASKREVFAQFLTEAGLIGVAGAVSGLALTALGLAGLRVLYVDSATAHLAHLETGMIGITAVVALAASLLAGLFPTWKACQIAPATQLKSN